MYMTFCVHVYLTLYDRCVILNELVTLNDIDGKVTRECTRDDVIIAWNTQNICSLPLNAT